MANWEFPANEPIGLLVNIASGSVAITAEQTEIVSVRLQASGHWADQLIDEIRVEYADGRLEIIEPPTSGLRIRNTDIDVSVIVPVGSRCEVRTASADVTGIGELGEMNVGTASGEISAATIRGTADLHSLSGEIALDNAITGVTAETASGRIRITHAGGNVLARSVSGSIVIVQADASVSARTTSGRVKVQSIARGNADINTVSGDIDVQVVSGRGVYLDLSSLSGRVRSELVPEIADPGEAELQLRCRSVSGSLRVARTELADVSS